MPCAIGAYGAACDNPRSYYDREGPLGVAITSLGVHADRFRVAGIGLGVGSLGAYCRREWDLTFLEIDPNVLRVAEAHFGYLRRGRGVCNSLSVLLGDGRVLMRSTTDELDLIVADAFSSDSVPTHLLTREAVDEVTTKLGPTGVLAYHVSSRYFNLQELVEAAAVSLGLPTVAVLDRGEAESLRAGSRWVFVSRSAEAIGLLREQFFGPERSFEDSGSRGQPKMWTDARHSLWTVLGVG
jgi:spermidine synthase